MGILDYFSKEKRKQRKLEKNIRRANNKFTPKDYRQIAVHEVIESATQGNKTAINGLLKRFAVNAEPSIEDEREKELVCDSLIDMGETVLVEIKKNLRVAESITWPLRALKNIISMEEYKDELLNILSEFDTEYERNPDRKIQIIDALAELRGGDIIESVIPFLEDVNETVRFQSVVTLGELGDELASEALLKIITPEQSIRVNNEIIKVFAETGWSTKGYKKQVAQVMLSGYRQDKKGKIIKLGQTE